MTDDSEKRYILLWSGGLDSTAVLLHMLSKPETFKRVGIVSCLLKNTNNYEEDKKAREAIIKQLGLGARFDLFDQEVYAGGCGGSQSTVWAWLSAMHTSSDEMNPVFCYGYTRGDDFWHYRPAFENAVSWLVRSQNENANVSFLYPLEWMTKRETISWYLNYPEVFRMISWGGDTVEMKLKEKADLEFIFEAMLKARRIGEEEFSKEKAKQIHENEENNTKSEESISEIGEGI